MRARWWLWKPQNGFCDAIGEMLDRCRSGMPIRVGFTHAGFAMRILLVDDEPLILKSFARYLGGVCGHDIVFANGGGEALAQLETDETADLIFCDLKMPDIDGIQVHRAICDDHPELRGRFVFLTGGLTDEATENYVQNSGARVLCKPVRQAAFDNILAEVGSA
jgi:CheY-like chemotaxis protein